VAVLLLSTRGHTGLDIRLMVCVRGQLYEATIHGIMPECVSYNSKVNSVLGV
jgi:hypothetical protein